MKVETLEDKLDGSYPQKSRFMRTKHLLGVLGLGSGTGLAEIDTLDRLNDVGVVKTPTSVSYTPGGYDLMGQLANNPIYHNFSHFLVTTGISGGPNNTLGILAASAALIIGGLSAKSYIKSKNQSKDYSETLHKKRVAVESLASMAVGVTLGTQTFLPAVNDVLYKAPMFPLGYIAIVGAGNILFGIYLGMEYLRERHSYKNNVHDTQPW